MIPSPLFRFLLIALLLLPAAAVLGQEAQEDSFEEHFTIYRFDIQEEIATPIARTTEKALAAAKEANADLILIHMNTYGGYVDAADEIRLAILKSEIPVFVMIENNAASAGALISIACDSIYMMPSSTIGAATVVNESGEAVPDKYQSYFRGKMRTTAEENGRNPKIAEAMVDPRKYVEATNIYGETKVVSDSGEVITFSTSEAIEWGYCEAQVNGPEDIYERLYITNYTEIEYEETWVDEAINWLIHPAVSGVLITIIFFGIYFELQSPGIGFPLLAAITAAVMYFAPHYLQGLAEYWEVLIFIVGLILIALEVFVIPGFGVAGILGIAATIGGLSLALIGNDGLDFTFVDTDTVVRAVFLVTVCTLGSVTAAIFIGVKFLNSKLFSFAILESNQNKEEGYVGTTKGLHALIGQSGSAFTMLRPSGKVEINNEVYDATAETGYIEKGDAITVVRVDTAQVIVSKA